MNMNVKLKHAATLMLASACYAISGIASAASFPDKPVKLVVPTAVGGAVDNVARIVAHALSVRWKHSVIVENKPGAGGMIGAAQLVRAPADGYTLGFISTGYTTLSSIRSDLSFDPVGGIAPVGIVGQVPFAMLVEKNSPYKTVDELVQFARQNPDKLSYASGGPGTLTHLLAAWFADEAKINMLHVPYGGAGPALQALLGKQVSLYFDPISTSAQLVKDGRLNALGTTGEKRSDTLPDVKTLSEDGFRVQGAVWFGMVAPAGTNPEIVNQINLDLEHVLAEPATRKSLISSGIDVESMTTGEFKDFLASQTALWKKVIQQNSIHLN